MNKFMPTTAHPEEPLEKPIWMKRIARKEIDLSKINTGTFLGFCVVNGYGTNPEQVLLELASQAKDNRQMVEAVIGTDNLKLII